MSVTNSERDAALPQKYAAKNKIRIVSATSLFDGHDAAINVMRRILQSTGAEVIHLGHNLSVGEIVRTALQEDVQAIAISSYQGGHIEFFQYMIDMLRENGAENICVFGGGGGVIVAHEIKALEKAGVTRIYSPEDGQRLGLQGMINDMCEKADYDLTVSAPQTLDGVTSGNWHDLARLITVIENGCIADNLKKEIQTLVTQQKTPPVFGITGTGGAGKSSLTDEIIRRFRIDRNDELKIAIIAIDPTRRRSGGALLGDRIRMNAIDHPNIYMRSIATRDSRTEVPDHLADIIDLTKLAGFDLIIVETPGIGQGNAGLLPLVDASLYVMTPEFGAASQLEKIDMLDFADIVAINKFDRQGADDALRDVRKQVQRNREDFSTAPEDLPIYGTIAARFNDDGVTSLYHGIREVLKARGLLDLPPGQLPLRAEKTPSGATIIVPPERRRYLAEIAETVRDYHAHAEAQADIARERQQLTATKALLEEADKDASDLAPLLQLREDSLDSKSKELLAEWPELFAAYQGEELVTRVRDREIRTRLFHQTLSGSSVAKVALPGFKDDGEILKWRLKDNLPGEFPFTAGVFKFKREGEDPARMFAGEGDAAQTNKRFKALSEHAEAKRLSTAFDSVTLYGCDPDERPDIYGKIGNSGVSIATLEDIKVLYDGFDLCDPRNSVSMTINGPAPTILAFFLNTAIDRQLEKFEKDKGRAANEKEAAEVKSWVLENVRGTVQADILKEDQGQNTCIFSTEFSLKVMGDIASYFVEHNVRNFYSVSISGYHIAEAGANPISQLAFTLANGFTYVEAYLARGLKIDDFAPNLSFFFSNGMDPEYTVLGSVARRIWSTTMRDKYGASERSQKLKYHIQTSGRSLHAQEMAFNDIRTTLQALIASYDNCNSLHTNAYDEAVTTPTEESVRRALAIQLVINREWGLSKNENPNQGSFIIGELTDLVEEAVLKEFESISERGGVLGAMETGYQRGKIQEESMLYEQKKHDGSLPIVGVNTFVNPTVEENEPKVIELARSTDKVKQDQLARLKDFHQRHADEVPGALEYLKQTVLTNGNVFSSLMVASRVCSLGQITEALFEVGGQYRRNM